MDWLGHDRVSRRTLLHAGMLAGGAFAGRSLSAGEALSGGTAKQVVLLFMWGGPSQIDTFDPKPHAPKEIRGPFATIPTNVPGIQISEHFQQLAARSDKLCFIRSMTHDDPAHLSSAHTLLTGQLPPVNYSDNEPPSDRDTPHMGSVMSALRPATGALPSSVVMPWQVFHPSAPGGRAPGQHGGWLGRQYDPFYVLGDPNLPDWRVPALTLIDGQSPERLSARQQLLLTLETQQRRLGETQPARRVTHEQSQAFGLLTSAVVRGAFDLQQETAATRDRYGRNIHGQCVLLARRLIDHGVPFVAVNWHNDGHNFWDTHGNNFNRLKDDLIPPSDRAFASLLDDLSASGKLQDTLVIWAGEFGRAPKINGSTGRDHHPRCYTSVLAGGGVKGGQVYGKSDEFAALPADNPVTPHDLAATIYHALGVPEGMTLPDSTQRPHSVYSGRPLTSLFG
ncbi:MAG: DUF1501 domain-containing protein [Planctomycetaceae bacterium]|nr:DUF1501 domain-containing protein [Planctomycetaceae bacterium]